MHSPGVGVGVGVGVGIGAEGAGTKRQWLGGTARGQPPQVDLADDRR